MNRWTEEARGGIICTTYKEGLNAGKTEGTKYSFSAGSFNEYHVLPLYVRCSSSRNGGIRARRNAATQAGTKGGWKLTAAFTNIRSEVQQQSTLNSSLHHIPKKKVQDGGVNYLRIFLGFKLLCIFVLRMEAGMGEGMQSKTMLEENNEGKKEQHVYSDLARLRKNGSESSRTYTKKMSPHIIPRKFPGCRVRVQSSSQSVFQPFCPRYLKVCWYVCSPHLLPKTWLSFDKIADNSH